MFDELLSARHLPYIVYNISDLFILNSPFENSETHQNCIIVLDKNCNIKIDKNCRRSFLVCATVPF